LLLKSCGLLVAPRLLALLPLGLLGGEVLFDRLRRDPLGQLRDHGGGGQLVRLVDPLPVGSGESVLVRQPLGDEKPQDDGERCLRRW
jgi:hypothetical protein